MITEQDWKEFQEHREEQARNCKSGYFLIPRKKDFVREVPFLFSKIKKHDHLAYQRAVQIYMQDVDILQRANTVDPETVEACLNWKMRRTETK